MALACVERSLRFEQLCKSQIEIYGVVSVLMN